MTWPATWEIILIIGFWFAALWTSRLLFTALILKLIGGMIQQAKDQIMGGFKDERKD